MRRDIRFFESGARTNFSFLQGASRPGEMVHQASAIGIAGLGIADRNSVAGAVRSFSFVNEMREVYERQKKEGLREEIMPSPCAFQPGARLVFSDGTPDILTYPKNRRGWANLCRLLSRGNLRAFDLMQHHYGRKETLDGLLKAERDVLINESFFLDIVGLLSHKADINGHVW
jgi:DNA polymerase III alpha subunit